jgi:hypothetical protein
MEHILSGLVTKRQEIKSEYDHLSKKLSEMADKIKTIDSTIKIFKPEFQTSTIKDKRFRTKNSYFNNGELGLIIFDILRKEGALSTTGITKMVMAKKGFEDKIFMNIAKLVLANIKRQEKSIKQVETDTHECYWELVKLSER